MHLRRLDLVGFKSFANRTTFLFERGVSVMCGPNGSGKSNVADAVRWSLGETSARAIRGRKGEDVIFVGSQGRQPLGLAEVSLTLDNADGRIPLDFEEVKITRRLYRSGEAECLVNGSKVRLRDIHQWLQHAALDVDGYVVVGQGSVDELILQRPEERRIVVENAADIRRHQARVAETRSRLAGTEENLLRCRTVVAELEPHVTRLRAQAERAERARACRDELTALAGRWFRHALRDARQELAQARREAAEAREAVEVQERELADLESLARAAEQAIAVAEARVGVLEPRLNAARADVSRIGQELARADERAQAARDARARLESGSRGLEERAAALAAERDNHQTGLERARQAIVEAEALVAEGAAADREQSDAARKAQDDVAAARRGLGAADNQLRSSLAALDEARGRIERIERRRERLADDLGRVTSAYEAARTDAAARAADAERSAAALQAARQARDAHTVERQQARHEAERLRAEQHSLAGELQRLTIARDGVRDSTVNGPDAAAALVSRVDVTGIGGPLGGELLIAEEHQAAIGAALADSARALLAADLAAVEQVIELLTGHDGGRVGLLVADEAVSGCATEDNLPPDVRDFQDRARCSLGDLPIVGFADALTGCPDRLQVLSARLLGRTIVVRDLAHARKAAHRLQAGDPAVTGWQIVTLEGTIIRWTGEWWIGRDRAAERLVGRQRELARLEREASKMAEGLARVEASLTVAAERLAGLDRRERALHDAVTAAEGTDRKAALAAHTATAQASRLERELREAHAAGPALERDHARARAHQQQSETRHDEVVRRRAEAASALAQAEEAARNVSARRDVLREAHAARQMALAARRAEIDGVQALLTRTTVDAESAARAVAEARQQLAGERERAAEQERLVGELREAHRLAEAAVRPVAEELDAARQARQEARARRVAVDQRASEVRAVVRGRHTILEAAAIAEGRAADRLERVQREAQEYVDDLTGGDDSRQLRLDLGATGDGTDLAESTPPDDPDDGFDPETARRRMTALRRELRSIGDVGEATLAEFRELSDRHAFLVEQIADLEGAAAELHRVMDELTGMMREAFDAAFTRVNVAFGEYFGRLFAGGHAELVLSDPDEPLASGVDIVARPPGKRLQPLVSLSGGERALTMIALIFALLKTNPAPFCVLDEVDAALDESNVRRFTGVLRELSDRTQFVVVSHNRATMEMAEALYGISMDTNGVSTVVSLKLPGDDGTGEPSRNGNSHEATPREVSSNGTPGHHSHGLTQSSNGHAEASEERSVPRASASPDPS